MHKGMPIVMLQHQCWHMRVTAHLQRACIKGKPVHLIRLTPDMTPSLTSALSAEADGTTPDLASALRSEKDGMQAFEDDRAVLKARDLASLFWAYGSFRFVPPELAVLVEVSQTPQDMRAHLTVVLLVCMVPFT